MRKFWYYTKPILDIIAGICLLLSLPIIFYFDMDELIDEE